MTMPLAGVLLPVVTTFDARGELDLDAFAANLESHRADRPAGFVLTGSTGEAALLEDDERIALIERGARTVRAGEWLIAGTGSESTRATIRRTKAAAAAGARAALVVAPHYYGSAMSSAALEAHFRRVADASPIPIILYSVPKFMHFPLPADVVQALARHGNVIGLKDSSGDPGLLRGYLAAQTERFAVLAGNGTAIAPSLEAGARGAVLGVALFAGPLVRSLFDAFAAGDFESARARQRLLTPIARRIVGELGVAGVKAAMDAVGLRGGAVRPPLMSLGDADRAEVSRLLREATEPVEA